MAPLGIGLDLVEIARVKRLLGSKGERALRRLLTDDERAYCLAQSVPERHVAARVAAKEAAYKALSQTDSAGPIGWREVEVIRDLTGRPALRFHGRALATARRLRVADSLVSLTHTEDHAAAVVVLLA